MALSTAGKNSALDSVTASVTHLALFTAYPADTPVNEVTGGTPAYARTAATWATAGASSGTISLDNSPAFNVPNGTDVQWIGGMTASASGTLLARWPLAGEAQEFAVATGTDVFTATGHGFSDTNTIVFYGGSAPTGITVGTVYFARDVATDTFKVAATSGGSAIDITGQPSTGDHVVSRITVNSGAQRTVTVTSLSLHMNF
jgi:hypothetical protein